MSHDDAVCTLRLQLICLAWVVVCPEHYQCCSYYYCCNYGYL